MRVALGVLLAIALLTSCAETVRCPEGEIFDDAGACVPIPDGGPTPPDGGAPDGG